MYHDPGLWGRRHAIRVDVHGGRGHVAVHVASGLVIECWVAARPAKHGMTPATVVRASMRWQVTRAEAGEVDSDRVGNRER